MKLKQITESVAPDKRYMLMAHNETFNDLMEFATDDCEWFEDLADFQSAFPKAQMAYLFFSNPGKDYRGLQPQINYATTPDFSIWMTGTGKLIWKDDLGEADFTEIPDDTVQKLFQISVGFNTFEELAQLIQKDNTDHDATPFG